MELTSSIALLFGLFGSFFLILSALSTIKSRLLLFAIISSLFIIGQFFFLANFVAIGTLLVSITRNLLIFLSLAKSNLSWLNHWLFIPVFIVIHTVVFYFVTDWANFSFIYAIPYISAIFITIAVFFKNLIATKSIMILAGGMWLFYEIMVQAFGMIPGEFITLTSNSIALFLLIKAARTNTQVFDPPTEVIEAITTSIPIIKNPETILNTVPVITTTIPLPIIENTIVDTVEDNEFSLNA